VLQGGLQDLVRGVAVAGPAAVQCSALVGLH
jgi:hypothetical protein